MTSPYQPPGPYEPQGPGSGPETPPQSGPPGNYPPPPNYGQQPPGGYPPPGQQPYGQPYGAPGYPPPAGPGGLPPVPPGYGVPGGPGGPGGFQPGPPKKSNAGKIVLIVVGVILAFCVVSSIIGIYAIHRGSDEVHKALASYTPAPFPTEADPSSTDESAPTGAAATPSGGATFGSAQTVTDSGWTLNIHYLQCDIPRLGSGSIAGEDAKGQYCVVNLTVKNGTNESTRFFSSGQQAFDSAGTEYRSDLLASTYANYKDHQDFVNPIAPGGTATGFVAWDMPTGKTIAKLQLHGELFDTGVVVQVS
jgi:hypothetical protein